MVLNQFVGSYLVKILLKYVSLFHFLYSLPFLKMQALTPCPMLAD